MSKNSNRSNGGGARNDFPIFAAILLGIVMGLALAAVIAWFVLKKNTVTPPPAREPVSVTKPSSQPEKPAGVKPASPSGTQEEKARFEFYKELTDKPSGKKHDRQEPAQTKPVSPAKPAESAGNLFLQEGAYTSMEDAEKVKAKLALLGMVAQIQPANIPDKGLWYRVRLGPYKTTAERDDALSTLKQNGLNAVTVKPQ